MMAKAASARGLFRATGKSAKPVQAVDMFGAFSKVAEVEREPDDFYPTPVEATRAILQAEALTLRLFDVIWEPAAGDGAMVREMEAAGHRVFASDLVDRGQGYQICSFYDYPQAPAKAVLTNPPFKECSRDPGMVRFMLEALRVDYLALLLPLNWLGAESRMKLWKDFPPARVYVMRWRVDFTGGGSPPIFFCWVVWDYHPLHRDRAGFRTTSLFTLNKPSNHPDLFEGGTQ